MTPLDQASAILKAADEATPGDWQSQHQNDLDGQLTIIGNVDGPDDGRFTFTNICDVDEAPDECFANARLIILARNTAPAIALALIEKHRALEAAEARIATLTAERDKLHETLNTPHIVEFMQAVIIESGHQRLRWASTHDAGKEPEDWFWLLGYLGGKALSAAKNGDVLKAAHHCISSAAALSNWHSALLGKTNIMRPGIDPEEHGCDAFLARQGEAG